MQRSSRAELVENIRTVITKLLEFGEVSTREISKEVIRRHEALVQGLGMQLAAEKIRDLTGQQMKRFLMPDASDEYLQMSFDLGALPSVISIPVKDSTEGEVKWISLRRAKYRHLCSHLDLLSRQILADVTQRDKIDALRGELSDIMQPNPEMTVAEALQVAGPSAMQLNSSNLPKGSMQ